ncbi:hypothetical protein B9Z65_48 [Elsinoe australis]|uniref:Uncharacterized protein n=1 Tax=Elsinoe australis TaxID=40998 RepID=A0A2P7ZKB2_9PEZI|nr:hypothetical protein B9Z65_48 [Elsinoe australis]
MLSFLYRSLNRLLPFATPGTPITTDLIHLAVLCSLLYFAPQIQSYVKDNFLYPDEPSSSQHDTPTQAAPNPDQDILNHNIDAVLGEDRPSPPHQNPDPVPQEHPDPAQPAPADALPPDLPAPDAPNPAGPAVAGPSTVRHREVGAKKAKSLARRDQRRAYHEFQRSQGEAQRARDAEGATEREAALAEERARRAAVEAELREEERREREERKERERREAAGERRAREVAAGLARDLLRERGWVDLAEVAGRVGRERGWLEGLVRAEGMVGEVQGRVVMVTGEGFLVRVGSEEMEEVWRALEGRVNVSGAERVGFEEVGSVLEGVLRRGGQVEA